MRCWNQTMFGSINDFSVLPSCRVPLRCREEEEEEGGGDVFSSAHCDCEHGEGLSLWGRLRSVRDYPPTALKQEATKRPRCPPPVPSSSVPSVMAFTLSEIMAARRQQSQQAQSHTQRGNRTAVEVDEYSTNPTQAFTFYNINQGRFQPPHVHMWVEETEAHCCHGDLEQDVVIFLFILNIISIFNCLWD